MNRQPKYTEMSLLLFFMLAANNASAALLSWNISYTGWWEIEGGGAVNGTLITDESAAIDGFISQNELLSWTWEWTGNSFLSAFTISSSDAGASLGFLPTFDLSGAPNVPAEGLDQGTFTGGDLGRLFIDLEFLSIQNDNIPFPDNSLAGDIFAPQGQILISDPTRLSEVSEPGALAALAMGILGLGLIKRKRNSVPAQKMLTMPTV